MPPRGFSYPDQPGEMEILFVLDQPNRMEPTGRDRLDADLWIQEAKDPAKLDHFGRFAENALPIYWASFVVVAEGCEWDGL